MSSVQGAERKIRDEEKKQLRKKVKGQTVGQGHDGESSVNQPNIHLCKPEHMAPLSLDVVSMNHTFLIR